MKRIFSLCSAVAFILTGLTNCGGGGDENRGFVTPENFRSGAGFWLKGNPQFTIEPGASLDVDAEWPTLPNGSPAKPILIVPGSGIEEVPDDPETDVDEFRPAVDPIELTPTGIPVVVSRTVTAGNSKYNQAAVVTYIMTTENIGVASFSFDSHVLEDENLISSLGVGANTGGNNNWNNNNNANETLDRINLDSLAAVNVTIHFDFNTGYATVYITASGVMVEGEEEDENDGYSPVEVVLTAAPIPFMVKK